MLRILIDKLFSCFFCQDTYQAFLMSPEYAMMKAYDLIPLSYRTTFPKRKDSAKVQAKRQDSMQANLNSNQISNVLKKSTTELYPIDGTLKMNLEKLQDKSLYEACFDMSILVALTFCGGGDTHIFHHDLSKHLIQAFIKHLRSHMHHSHKGFNCYQSVHAMLTLLQNCEGEQLYQAAKERDQINFLFNMTSSLFSEEANSVALRLSAASAMKGVNLLNSEFNLNSLIIGQGFQGQQQIEAHNERKLVFQNPSLNASSQQLGQGNQTTGKVRSSFQVSSQAPISAGGRLNSNPISHSPLNGASQHLKKEEIKSRDKAGFLHKLSFNRAVSEPPSANKNNAVLPVTEDYGEHQSSSSGEHGRKIKGKAGMLEEVQEEEPQQQNRFSKGGRKSSGKANQGEKPVPPLQISQIHHIQQQIQTPSNIIQTAHNLQPQTTINSSSMVMTSYLNMPLGMFNSTLNHLSSNSRHGGGGASVAAGPNFKLNFVPQTTSNTLLQCPNQSNLVAKSRLTRRQMSMSRKHTQKFSSVSTFAQGPYGEDLGSRDPPSKRIFHDYGSVDRQINTNNNAAVIGGTTTNSQNRKVPAIPKLNINQIVFETGNQNQRIDTTSHPLNSTSHALAMTNHNMLKSSNRSHAYSNQNFENQLQAVQQKMSGNPYQQTTTSQFLKQHQQTQQFLQPALATATYHDSERNISIYDDINGSFIDDMGMPEGAQTVMDEPLFENAEEKLRQLAIQLGEACLTNDLAALINQKREIELVKSARKSVHSGAGFGSQSSKAYNHKMPMRSVSVSYSYEPFFHRGESKIDPSRFDSEEMNNQQEPIQDDCSSLTHKARLLILNLSYQLLKRYDLSETRFLKHPINALNAYLESKQFKKQRREQGKLALEEGKSILFDQEGERIKMKAQVKSSGNVILIEKQGNHKKLQKGWSLISKCKNQTQILEHMIGDQISEFFIDQEQVVIFKIYQKFTFVNEDIIKNQVNNELANFAARERGFFGNALPFQSKLKRDNSGMMVGNQIMNLNLPLPGSSILKPGSQLLQINDSESSASSTRDAQSSISNPNIMWSSNGIGFDFSTASDGSNAQSSAQTTFQKERIRKKLDVLLYTIDRRIKHLITQQLQQYQNLERPNITFAKGLKNELSTLTAYLESQKSRIMLFQVIEVILESLLMIKKCLIDVSLKTSIFVADYSKQMSTMTPDQMNNPSTTNHGSRTGGNFNQFLRSPLSMNRGNINNVHRSNMIKTQRLYRQLFSEYLGLLTTLLSMAPGGTQINATNQETMRLLNEVFIGGDEQWQESVKNYVISLFLSDIIGSLSQEKLMGGSKENIQSSIHQHQLLIEELRGINLVNLDEQHFISTVSQSATALLQVDPARLICQTKKLLYDFLLCARNVMNYYQSILQFYHTVISQHFTHKYGNQKTKQPNSASGTKIEGSDNTHLKDGNIGKNDPKIVGGGADLRRGSAMDQQNAGFVTNIEETNQAQQKYWKQVIRRVLYHCMYLITPPNGLISSYLQNNSINYVNMGPGSSTNRFNQTGRGGMSSVSPTRAPSTLFMNQYEYLTQDQQNLTRNGLCPLTFKLTMSSLSFLRLVFDLPEQFTKYAFLQEELMLFYIRTHYISFVRLYNKNFSKKQQNASQLAIESKQRSMTLCKAHLECLFSIARNRSEDTRRKLYQFKILQFLCQEVELEYESTNQANRQRRTKLIEEARDVQKAEDIMILEKPPKIIEIKVPDDNDIAKKPSLALNSAKISFNQEQLPLKEVLQSQNFEFTDNTNLQPPPVQKKISFVPKLNIGGLGLSEIIPENNNKTQIEIDQLRQLVEEQKKKAEANPSNRSNQSKREGQKSIRDIPKPKLLVPKLQGVEKLGYSGLMVVDSNRIKYSQEEDKQEPVVIQQVTVIKKPSFSIPKLQVAGLGFSDLKQEEPVATLEQSKPLTQIQENKAEPYIDKLPLSSSSSDDEEYKQPIMAPIKKMPFAMPKLNINGLGHSDLVPDTTSNIVEQQNEQQQMMPPIKKGLPFGMPKLNVAGLGLSDLKQEDAAPPIQNINVMQPQEQSVAPATKKEEAKSEPYIDKLPLSASSSDAEEEQQPQAILPIPTQTKKLPFAMPKLNINGLGHSDLIPDVSSVIVQNQIPQQQVEEEKSQAPPKKKGLPFGMPKLNVAGLGLSDLIQDDKDKIVIQQEEKKLSRRSERTHRAASQEKLPEAQQEIYYPPPVKKMPFGMPKLKVEGLGFSDLKPDDNTNVNATHQNVSIVEESKIGNEQIQMYQPHPVKKGLPFGMPKLKVEGLGFSDLTPCVDQMQQIQQLQIAPQEPPKRPSFTIPKLKVEGLGFTDIIPDSQPTLPQNTIIQDLSTINPNVPAQTSLNTINNQTINYGTEQPLFHVRQSQREHQFENTAPLMKLNDNIEDSSQLLQGTSAPQENRKKTLQVMNTRNNPSELSMQESLESAQYIQYANKGAPQKEINYNISAEEKLRLIKLRDSQESNATHLRVESILEGRSALDQYSLIPSPFPDQQQALKAIMTPISNFMQTPQNMMSSGRSINEEEKTSNPQIKLNLSQIQDEQIPEQEIKQINVLGKKPLIPSLKIPAKTEQPEGKEKMQLQIEQAEYLNEKIEGGDLTKLQNQLNKNNVKFQVLIDHQKSNQSLTVPPSFPGGNTMIYIEDADDTHSQLNEEEAFYLRERSMRPIYQDEELHALMLSLIVCLVLSPERGTLDELYCSQYPLDNGKQHILFLLHHHMNHPRNKHQTFNQKVLTRVHRDVNPPLAGLRLLKLLSTSLFDINLYNNGKEWKKIAEGAYAKVYESKTNLVEPQQVAVKQMQLPKSIYDRCVLHDIFTEITCLEELRLEPFVSDLYDYGVDGNSFYVIMKRYTCSLRQWRLQQTKSLNENLSLYLSVYKEFLKSLMTIHSHNVTHYDIKCDNVFLDLSNTTNGGQQSLSQQFSNSFSGTGGDNEDDNKIKLTIGDFGECKIFSNEKDELCQRNRGTDFCKSPEMLQLTINTRKDTDKYDRRKQVGTNRLSDVWSAGCLFYELLTGEYLFYTPDYLQFHFRVTRPSEALFTPERLEKINNNVYLIDFMKYMLVRDPRLRPTTENVLKRFEHVHALLVSTTGGGNSSGLTNYRLSMGNYQDINNTSQNQQRNLSQSGGKNFDQIIDQASQMMLTSSPQCLNLDSESDPFIIKIMEDVSLCNFKWFKKYARGGTTELNHQVLSSQMTHLVLPQDLVIKSPKLLLIKDHYEVLELKEVHSFADGTNTKANSFLNVPKILDYLRKVSLTRGRVLFIESSENPNLTRESILLSLTHIFQTNSYETYTLIRSQNLFFKLFSTQDQQRLAQISQFTNLTAKVHSYLSTYPRFQCRCGSCLIILKRKYANYSNMETVTCNCSKYYRNIDTSQCPSPGCSEFIQYMKTFFKVSTMDNLHWGFLDSEDLIVDKANSEDPFIVGPKNTGNLHHKSKVPSSQSKNENKFAIERMIASNMSQGIDANSNLVSVIDKKGHPGMIHQNSRKAMAMHDMLYGNSNSSTIRWKLYKCKECHVWTHAVNEAQNKFALLLNNRIKETSSRNHYVNIRSLNSKQQIENGHNSNVRVPTLQKIKLSLPF